MKKKKLIYFCITFLLLSSILSTCSFISTGVESLDYDKARKSGKFVIHNSTKVHLYDGSVVVYENGFEMNNEVIKGKGIRHDLTRQNVSSVALLPVDSVASIEYYEKNQETGPFLTSVPPVVVTAAAGTAVLLVAIFGSCPTVYTFNGEEYALEAETFSYSIARRFESADLDRLDFGKVLNGKYILKVANEALETHYINSLSLLTVDHPVGYEAFPTNQHAIVLFGTEGEIISATSKSGDDVSELISARDGRFYESDSLELQELTHSLTRDWIDVNVKIPKKAEKMVIAVRLRNTLMNTVLFYDIILASQGIKAIDWLGSKTSNLFYAWRLGNWYKKHFGLHIQMFDGKEYRDAVRIGDKGPIAWHQHAVEISPPDQDVARLRFAFLPDNLFIDWIGVSFETNDNYQTKMVESSAVSDFDQERRDGIRALIKEKDDKYLVTYPGESYVLEFQVDPVSAERRRSYFLKSRGYYIEWLRKEWIVQNPAANGLTQFELNDETIKKTAQLWLNKKPDFEKAFFESKIYLRETQND